MYSDVAPDNASWLVSNGQYNAKTVYPDYYDWLVEQMNAGVSGFVASTATYTDYDFVINTADQTFRLPLKNGQEGIFADGVKGNGIAIGLVDRFGSGHALGGQAIETDNGYSYYLASQKAKYGTAVGTGMGGFATPAANTTFGLTTDPSKSGMVVDKTVPSGWNLYYYVGDTVQDASLINAGAVLGQLSDKISRTATSDKELVVGWVMPDYTAKIETQNTTYTAPTKGWFYVVAQGSELKVSINSVQLAHGTRSATSYNICYSLPYMVNTGDVIAVTGADVSRETPLIAFYPCKCVSV